MDSSPANPQTQPADQTQTLSPEELAKIRTLISGKAAKVDYPLLISALAFLLSLTTSIISAWTNYRKDIHDQQAQLAGNIQSLQDLSIKQTEIKTTYKEPQTAISISSLIHSQENTVLHNASDLAKRLGTNATTTELVTIARGLINYGSVPESRQLLQTALKAAQNANEESLSLRNLGALEIKWANSPEMREQGQSRFRQAENLETKYPDLAAIPGTVAYLKALANLNWASAVAFLNCRDARGHWTTGMQYLAGAPSSPDIEELRIAAANEAKNGLGGVRTCLPPEPPPA